MWYLYGVAVLAGIANAVEPGQNATLAKVTGQPMLAGVFCFSMAILAIVVVMIVGRRVGLPGTREVSTVPWWAWPGGALGAAVVLAQLYMSERLGAAPFLGLLVTGGVVASILLDHFSLVGFTRRHATPGRIAGGVLMIVGVALVAIY